MSLYPGADWHFFWGGVMALKGPVGRGQALMDGDFQNK